jgi:hypothetical protein
MALVSSILAPPAPAVKITTSLPIARWARAGGSSGQTAERRDRSESLQFIGLVWPAVQRNSEVALIGEPLDQLATDFTRCADPAKAFWAQVQVQE